VTYKLYSKRDGKFTADLSEKIDSLPAGVLGDGESPGKSGSRRDHSAAVLLPNTFFNIESGGPCKGLIEACADLKLVFGKA